MAITPDATSYDDSEELTGYLFDNYFGLMSDEEKLAWKSSQAAAKANHSSGRVAEILREKWVSSDPEVTKLLCGGLRSFKNGVRDRLLAELHEEITINRCPKCERVVRTPKAKQCLWCGADWH